MPTSETHRAIEAVWRIESARLIAGLARIVGDIGLAEDLAQDALVAALEQWPESGVPDNPGAWLMATAKHRAIDQVRRRVEQVLTAHPRTSLQIMENMADRFIDLVQLTADLSLRPVEARLAKLLLEAAEAEVIPRRRWTTQVELAARLGTVPDVLSRIEREFTRAGLIEMDKQQIRILDRPGLTARARLED